MEEHYTAPRFFCKSIMKWETGWMVTYPDYEGAGDNPFSVREVSRPMTTDDLLDWMPRRLERLGTRRPKLTLKPEEIIELPLEKGKRVRSTIKMKKLNCGHLAPRRKGAYPRRCEPCLVKFNERIKELRRSRHA
jgi:hypothetical protein